MTVTSETVRPLVAEHSDIPMLMLADADWSFNPNTSSYSALLCSALASRLKEITIRSQAWPGGVWTLRHSSVDSHLARSWGGITRGSFDQ